MDLVSISLSRINLALTLQETIPYSPEIIWAVTENLYTTNKSCNKVQCLGILNTLGLNIENKERMCCDSRFVPFLLEILGENQEDYHIKKIVTLRLLYHLTINQSFSESVQRTLIHHPKNILLTLSILSKSERIQSAELLAIFETTVPLLNRLINDDYLLRKIFESSIAANDGETDLCVQLCGILKICCHYLFLDEAKTLAFTLTTIVKSALALLYRCCKEEELLEKIKNVHLMPNLLLFYAKAFEDDEQMGKLTKGIVEAVIERYGTEMDMVGLIDEMRL